MIFVFVFLRSQLCSNDFQHMFICFFVYNVNVLEIFGHKTKRQQQMSISLSLRERFCFNTSMSWYFVHSARIFKKDIYTHTRNVLTGKSRKLLKA